MSPRSETSNHKMLELYQAEMTDDVFKRCTYIVEENERVRSAAASLHQNDLQSLGRKMYETHVGLSTHTT